MKFLRKCEVCALIGVSSETLRRWEAEGTFPKRIKLNPKGGMQSAVVWRESDIRDWMARAGRAAGHGC